MQINSQRVACILAERQMNRAALAAASGLTRSQLTVVLKRGRARELTVGRIADGLGVSVTEIAGLSAADRKEEASV